MIASVVRLALAWIAMLVAQIAVGTIIHLNNPPPPHAFLWLMVSNAFTVLPVGAAALRSDWRGWRLLSALFFITGAAATVNLIEGAVYLPNVGLDWRGLIILELLSLAVAALLWLIIFRAAPLVESSAGSPLPHRSLAQKMALFALCSACYVFLYFLAGTIIFPFVSDFYATQHIPTFGRIVSLQFFLRGPVFILVCLTLLRMFRLPHLPGALGVGLAFTSVSAVANLIMPNGIFPDPVRWAHFCEVTSSNFVFGFVVGWLWGHARRVSNLAPAAA